MSGMQHIPIQQHGRLFHRLWVFLLLIAILFSGCSTQWWIGDGRGDWTQDLINNYAITKVNSREILLILKSSEDTSGGKIVIEHYFVKRYQVADSFILLEGVAMRGLSATEEELHSEALIYYAVDTVNNKIEGPLGSYDELKTYCASQSVSIDTDWKKTS